jgi:hypothetical protein
VFRADGAAAIVVVAAAVAVVVIVAVVVVIVVKVVVVAAVVIVVVEVVVVVVVDVVVVVVVKLAVTSGEKINHMSRDLLRVDSNGLHFYFLKSFEPTLNKSRDVWLIFSPLVTASLTTTTTRHQPPRQPQ